VKATCNALGSNLETGDLAVWFEVDTETLVVQHLGEEDITSSVKSGKTADEFGAYDTGSDSENSSDDSDDSSETAVPKLNKVLENINEVMTW
jgi:hypothetical protein